MKSNWTKTSLGQLQNEGKANVQTGPFGTVLKASEYSSHGVPVISVGEIRCGYIQTSDRTPLVSEETKSRLPQFVLEERDIVFGRKGAIDRNAIVSKGQSGWFLGSDGIRLRLSEEINSNFVSYQLRSSSVGKWLLHNSSASIMPSLNQKILDRLPIWLPEINEQEKIADVLSALDAKIDCNKRINAELEIVAKTLHDYWFVQFDFPGANGKPYKSSGGKMRYNATLKREIPEGWVDGTLNDLGQIVGGSTPSTKKPDNFTTNNGTPWITPNDLSDNQSNKFITRGAQDVSYEGIKDASLKKYPAGTVLLSSRAPIGYMAIARTELTTNQGFKSFIPCNGYSSAFIYYTVMNSLKAITQYASGSTFKEVSGAVLKTVKITRPERSVVEDFTKRVEPFFRRQDLLEQENQQLTQLRDWLLPMLMNGQITVA